MKELFHEIEIDNREHVLQDTWGHLAPIKNKKYQGKIVFAVGCYDSDYLNPTVLYCQFKDLQDSPWFYDALKSLLWSTEFKVGKVYLWEGIFKNYKFVGNVSEKLNSEKV